MESLKHFTNFQQVSYYTSGYNKKNMQKILVFAHLHYLYLKSLCMCLIIVFKYKANFSRIIKIIKYVSMNIVPWDWG